jgi:hypothetical protein
MAYNYTLTLGEFREATKDLPDDAEIYVDEGDLQYWEVRFASHRTSHPTGALPPVLEHPWAIALEMKQVWNQERDIDHRLDAALGNYGDRKLEGD